MVAREGWGRGLGKDLHLPERVRVQGQAPPSAFHGGMREEGGRLGCLRGIFLLCRLSPSGVDPDGSPALSCSALPSVRVLSIWKIEEQTCLYTAALPSVYL